jgi:type I restriction enzyme S subunit
VFPSPPPTLNAGREGVSLILAQRVLFARTGATTGKTHLVESDTEAVFASYLIRVRPRLGVQAEYLHAFFQSDSYWEQIIAEKEGSAQPNVNGGKLMTILVPAVDLPLQGRVVEFLNVVRKRQDGAQIELPLLPPPIEEQRRIVELLDCLALKVRSARQLAADCAQQGGLVLCRWISQLRFAESDWMRVAKTVVDKLGAVRSGPFGSQLHHEEFVTEGIAAIGTRDVQVNHLTLQSGWYVRPEKFDQFRRYQVFPGDLLCTIVGASIGRFCTVPDGVPTAFTTKHIMALTLNRRIAEPEYISQVLNAHERCRKSMFSQCEGSAQPSLNARKVLTIEIPLPSLDRQREILCEIHNLRSKVDCLKSLSSGRTKELDALMPSVLNHAFSGKL